MKRTLLLAGSAYVCLGASLALPAHAASVEQVVVTVSPIAGSADRFATIVDSVDRSQILANGGANLADALKDIPGVTGTNFAGGASRPVIRGFGANRVRILEDGIDSFDVSDVGPDHGVPIDPLSAQRIEVVRGAATLRYGSQAIAGVVNAINNRIPMELPDVPFTGEASAGYTSNGAMTQESALLDGRIGDVALHGDGFHQRRSNYDIPGGTQPNSYFRGDGFSLGGSYFPTDNTHLGAAVIHYDSKYGIPSDTTFIDMRQTKLLTRSVIDVEEGPLKTVNVDAGYAAYQHQEIDPATGDVLSTFKDHGIDSRMEAVFGEIGPLSAAALGIQFQNRNFSALGEGTNYLLPTHTRSFAGFAFVEAPLGPAVHLQAGARVEQVRAEGTPASLVPATRDFTPVSGSVGVLWDASDALKLGLTVSSAARAPAQTELFARGPHDGPGTFETGDPSLSVERANSIEGTARLRLDGLRVEASVWGVAFNNFIYGDVTGRTCDDAGVCVPNDSQELRELIYRQRSAQFWGLEAKGTVDLGDLGDGSLAANFIADYVRATFGSGAGNVPRIPPYHLGAGLSWSSERFDASVMLIHSGRQDEIALNETPTAGFNELDATLAWRPFDSDPRVQLSLIGHNLTDDVQRSAVALNKDSVVLPGRSFNLLLDIKV
jgi:iron complex outermembrane receptor protein